MSRLAVFRLYLSGYRRGPSWPRCFLLFYEAFLFQRPRRGSSGLYRVIGAGSYIIVIEISKTPRRLRNGLSAAGGDSISFFVGARFGCGALP